MELNGKMATILGTVNPMSVGVVVWLAVPLLCTA
jgi:hypothetical protein